MEYSSEILRVEDGDTVRCRVSLGFGIHCVQRVQLRGVRVAGGKERAAAKALKALLPVGSAHMLTVFDPEQPDRYGRAVGDFWNRDQEQYVTTALRKRGLLEPDVPF